MLKAKNLFQNGSFDDICSLETNLTKYSLVDKSALRLTAVPILLRCFIKNITAGYKYLRKLFYKLTVYHFNRIIILHTIKILYVVYKTQYDLHFK